MRCQFVYKRNINICLLITNNKLVITSQYDIDFMKEYGL